MKHDDEFTPLVANPLCAEASAPPQPQGSVVAPHCVQNVVVEPFHISAYRGNGAVDYPDTLEVENSDSDEDGDPTVEGRKQSRINDAKIKAGHADGRKVCAWQNKAAVLSTYEGQINSRINNQQVDAGNLADNNKFKVKIRSRVVNEKVDECKKEIAYLDAKEDVNQAADKYLTGSGGKGGYQINESVTSHYDFGSQPDYAVGDASMGSGGYQMSEYKSIYD